jgi:AcrR family transcriptional regulator
MTAKATSLPAAQPTDVSPARHAPHARERILDAAYELFSRQGIRAVGIDTIVERSGVARMTLYRHFHSKDALALAFLERREQRWTIAWLQREVEQRAADPCDRLLAIFDVFDEWFQLDDFEGCSFINVLLEIAESGHVLHLASREYLARIRAFIVGLAIDAGIAEPEDFARQWHILMKGSIVAAGEGDRAAARRAKAIGALVLEHAPAAPDRDGRPRRPRPSRRRLRADPDPRADSVTEERHQLGLADGVAGHGLLQGDDRRSGR